MKKFFLLSVFTFVLFCGALYATPTEVPTEEPTSGPTLVPTAEDTITSTPSPTQDIPPALTYTPTLTMTPTQQIATATVTPTSAAPVLADTKPIAYPQPAMNTLSFAYRLSAAGRAAKVYVYNIAGSKVAEFDGTANAGTNVIPNIDITKMASGLYFYLVKVTEIDGSVSSLKLSKFAVER